MRDRSIRITMGLVFGTLMVIGALSVATTLWTIQTQQHDAAVVNLTGRQRMLSQKLVKEIWSSLLKGLERRDLSQIEATTYELEALRQTLVSGGQVSYASTTVLVPPASDPAFRAALEKAQTTLELLRRAGHAVLENEPGSPAFVQGSADLERLSSVILEELDQVTLLYQTLAEAKVTRLAWLQLAFLLGGASTLAAGTWLILTQVLRPVNSLEVAVQRMERGDLDSPVQVTVRNELGRLAQTFDVMRARVKEQITELVALNRASQAITSSLNIREVLDQIVDVVGSVVDAAYVSIMLVKEDGSLGISAENFREGPPIEARVRPQGITRQIIASRHPLVFDEVWDDGTHNPALVAAGVRSYAGLPLTVKDQVRGVLFVHSHVPGALRDRLPLLTTFANQATIAIENARLHSFLQEINARLQEAVRAKDEMIQNVSHELRTPLAIMMGFVELLKQGAFDPLTAEQERIVDILDKQSKRLHFMVHRLLTLQTLRPEALRKVELEVGPWLREVVQSWVDYAMAAGIEVQLEVSPDLPPIMADSDLLEQVVVNLLDNGIKFSPGGGVVMVRAWLEGDEVIMAVSDQGIGIPPDKLGRLFERFYQVDGSSARCFGGMGIGLALCKAIVEAHGGRIWAESAGEGCGSTFYVALPATTGGKLS